MGNSRELASHISAAEQRLATRRQLFNSICMLWCGAIIGLSFVATPAKFLVAELDIVTAVKIGRATFQIFSYVELIGSLVLIGLFISGLFSKRRACTFAVFLILVLMQYSLILPGLTEASNALFNDAGGYSATLHWYYVAAELLKCLLLVVLSWLPFSNKYQ